MVFVLPGLFLVNLYVPVSCILARSGRGTLGDDRVLMVSDGR